METQGLFLTVENGMGKKRMVREGQPVAFQMKIYQHKEGLFLLVCLLRCEVLINIQ